ncbi:hypothetical protein R5R35_005979 [Gryllus longicercus]|uniref:Odorant binding protein n=1 Tax=Gryllus longicercus TaxID=2509291 RepID=A0AAN9VH84_9ORTH
MHLPISVVVMVAFAVCGARGASTDKFKEVVEPVVKACKSEVAGATDADVEHVMHREELGTRTGMCLQYCVYEKLGGMKDGAVVSKEEALAVLHRIYDGDFETLQNASDKIDRCEEEVMERTDLNDGCDLANAVQQCFRKLH